MLLKSFLSVTLLSSLAFAQEGLLSLGNIDCTSATSGEIYYDYVLKSADVTNSDLEIGLEVRNYVCEENKSTEPAYSWKLVLDDTFAVRTSYGQTSSVTEYHPTKTPYVYETRIQIPLDSLLTPGEFTNFSANPHFESSLKNLRFRHWDQSYGALSRSFALQVLIEKDSGRSFALSARRKVLVP